MPPTDLPQTFKNLENHHSWPLKHRHWMFEIIEDEHHHQWVNTHDLRHFDGKFPQDRELVARYPKSIVYIKDIKTYFLSVKAMELELGKNKNRPNQNDVLIFLEWFERHVKKVAAKKRLHKNIDITQAPVTEPRAHPLVEYWQGKLSLPLSFLFGFLVLLIPELLKWLMTPRFLNWTSHWQWLLWTHMLYIVLTFVAVGIYALTLTRCFARHWRDWRLLGIKVLLSSLYVVAVVFGVGVCASAVDRELIKYWWATLNGQRQAVNAYADPYLGRIVFKGEFQFGSAEALETVLKQSPKLTLLQIEGAGGHVIEALRMKEFIEARNMDTVVLQECLSACSLVFLAGKDRYLGPEAQLGFHSGTRSTWGLTTNTGAWVTRIYRERKLDESFIQKATGPQSQYMWLPSHDDLYQSHYATSTWADRKAGY